MNNLYGQLSPGTGEPANHYYALFEQATDAIMVTDFEGNFKDMNPGLCSIFGYSKEELLQMNFCSLMDKQHLSENPIRFDLLAAGETVPSERKLTTRYGTLIYVECNAKKIAENRILSIARDITLRKKIEQELQEHEANLQTIFETTDTIYVLMNTELDIVSYNSKAIDFARKELGHEIKISNFFPDYFPKERRNTLSLNTSRALQGHQVKYETKYPQADGSENWYDVRFFPVIKNEIIYGLILSVVDVSEKKKLQKKLLEHTIEEQKSITRAVLKAQEVERNKIGQELHDNVNQILSTIRLHIGMIGREHNVNKEQLDTVKGYVDLALMKSAH